YRTVTQRLYLSGDHTTKVTYTMERLGAGEQPEPRPQPPSGPYQTGAPNAPYPPPTTQPPTGAPGQTHNAEGYGTISIRVQPADADVLIDGEPWRGPSDRDRLMVDVAEGRH